MDLAVFELIKGGTAVFEATGQFTVLNLLLAGVLVESALRDAQIFGRFRVLEPEILGRSFEGKARRVWWLGPNLLRDSCQRLAQKLNESFRVLRLKDHAGNNSGIARLSVPSWVSTVAHAALMHLGC